MWRVFNSLQKFSYCFLLCSLNFHLWFSFVIFSFIEKFWNNLEYYFLILLFYAFAGRHLRFFHVFFSSYVMVCTFVLFIEKSFRNESVLIVLILSNSNNSSESTYYVPSIIQDFIYIHSFETYNRFLQYRYYCYLHFTARAAETQRG